jgi:hypothetical protein
MPPYVLHLEDLPDDAVEISSKDEESLIVIRDEVKLHGFEVGKIAPYNGAFRFQAKSDTPGKVREFVMGLADVEVQE